MTLTTSTMTREQRKSVALELFKRFDEGGNFLELLADDAVVHFPKWGLAHGKDEIGRLFGDVAALFTELRHHPEYMNFVIDDDMVVVEGITSGTTADGTPWQGIFSHAGRFVDVLEIRDHKIHRLFIYLDPDFAGDDTDRYPWLATAAPQTVAAAH